MDLEHIKQSVTVSSIDSPGLTPAVDRDAFAKSVRLTMEAITTMRGADCVAYAIVGAEALHELGFKARPVAGYASWRVGPGDSDMVVHDPNANVSMVVMPTATAMMFHAWIELDTPVGVHMVDLTTFQLRDKSAALDSMDGQKTAVDFCPDYIWGTPPDPKWNAHSVTQSQDVGVYSYKRVPEIEMKVMAGIKIKEMYDAVKAVSFVYGKILLGESVQVIGVDKDRAVPVNHLYRPPSLKRP